MSPRTFGRVASAAILLALTSPAFADLRFVDNLPGTFIDISATGTSVLPPNDGEFNIVSTIGNSLLPAGTVRIASNGGARFGAAHAASGDLSPDNEALPSTRAFNGRRALLPFWDDFIASNSPFVFGAIQHEERSGVLIIQWTNVKLQSASVQDRITFQLQVPQSGDVLARFVYPDILGAANGGSGATIGYQGATVSDSAQYALNASRALDNGAVLSLIDIPNDTLVASLPGTFIDIAGTGTPLNLTGDATALITTQVRNNLVNQGDLRVGLNGGVRLSGSTNLLTDINSALPTGNVFGGNDALVPFWDDLESTGGAVGNVFWQDLSDRLVVQWNNVGFLGSSTAERVTFQVQIFDDSELLAQFLYADVEGFRAAGGGSATIGVQTTGGPGVQQHSFNTASVQDGTVLSLLGLPRIGTPYCVATNNSRGLAGRISARGNKRASNNNLFIDATDLPFNSAAFFIVSRDTAFVPLAGGSQGNLCLGGAIGRGVGNIVNTASTGVAIAHANLQAMPSPTGPFVVVAGDTLSFQCWYRDAVGGVATSNFSEGLQIQFEP